MLPLDIHNVRAAVLAAAIAISAIVLFDVAVAHAQIAVEDAPTEANTSGTWKAVDALGKTAIDIDRQDTVTATSVTTGGGGGWWHPQAAYLASLTANLDQGVDTPGSFVTNFPGWQSLPPYAVGVAERMSTLALNTYAGALTAAQQQAQNFPNEDAALSQIEAASSQSTALLQSNQALTEAVLALVQQQQLTRQLLIDLINLEAVKAGEELDERGQAAATTAQSLNFGIAP